MNPFGGKKSATNVFENTVQPLLEDAEIQFTLQGSYFVLASYILLLHLVTYGVLLLIETQYQLHAKELVHGLDLTKYDGVVCVSGDGILVEVCCFLLLSGFMI